jgi:hypothetical protein
MANPKGDKCTKTSSVLVCVIPAEAGIQFSQTASKHLDSGFHRSDDFSQIDQ